jgi:uncharacterized protein YraI
MRRPVLWVIGVLAAVAGVALAATRRAGRDVTVTSGPGSFYSRVGQLKAGTEVEVVGERGAWLEVRAGPLKGFVPRFAFTAEKERGGLLSKAIGSKEASVSTETAAAKGFTPEVERAHAKARGQQRAWARLERLERQRVSEAQMEAFLRKRGLHAGGSAP